MKNQASKGNSLKVARALRENRWMA